MLQVIGRASSINVRKVLWTCAEIGLGFERVDAGADHAALNPNRLVPVIRDGEFVLWESNAICRYLARQHGRSDLLPTEPRAQADVERWMDWQAGELNNAWRYAFMGLVRKSPAHTDAAQIASSIAHWNRHIALLETRLQATGAFITGTHFTLADVVLGLSVQRWWLAPIDRPALPAVAGYHGRLLDRPGFRTWGANGDP
ncbi:MAG TPA: glutathione S-transferase [Rubrivivax sp.]